MSRFIVRRACGYVLHRLLAHPAAAKILKHPKNLEAFFQMLDTTFRNALEFRNTTWLIPNIETVPLLKQYGVASTIVDEPLLPPEIHLIADFAYFRWQGKGKNIWFDYQYNEEELQPWVPKIQKTANNVKKAYGHFNYNGYAQKTVHYCLKR